MKTRLFASIVLCFLLVGCGWWAPNNPADPQGTNYQGYPTVATAEEVVPVSPATAYFGVWCGSLVCSELPGGEYQFQVSASGSWSDTELVADETSSTNSLSTSDLGLAFGSTYYWRVRARVSGGSFADWSALASTYYFTPTAPVDPLSISPSSGGSLASGSFLDWPEITGAAGYELQLGESEAAMEASTAVAPTASEYDPSGAISEGGTYHWRVRGVDYAGNLTLWSERFTFTSVSSSSLEGVLSNLNSSYTSITALIPSSYDITIDGTTGYSIYDSGDMYDTGNYLNTDLYSWIPYTSGYVSTLPSAFGGTGGYFTAELGPLFVMAADLSGVSSFSISGDLGADGSGYAEGYPLTSGGMTGFVKQVYGAYDPSVVHIIVVDSAVGASQTWDTSTTTDAHTVSGLYSATRIYYLLFAIAGGSYTSSSTMQSVLDAFVGIVESGGGSAPTVPALSSPANGSLVYSLSPTFSWSASSDTDGDTVTYDVYLDTSSAPTTLVASDLTATSYIFSSSLLDGYTYYWYVVADDGNGNRTPSATWYFTASAGVAIPVNWDFEDASLPAGWSGGWAASYDTAASGSYSLKSATISHSQSSSGSVAVSMPSGGYVQFYYCVSSESGYDYLRFYVDGTEYQGWSGAVSWAAYTTSYLSPGAHTLTWTYSKDSSGTSGSDCAWIDNVYVYY